MFSLNSHEIHKIVVIIAKGLEPATSCVIAQDICERQELSPIHASVIYQIP